VEKETILRCRHCNFEGVTAGEVSKGGGGV
jgi:hypothetical protein